MNPRWRGLWFWAAVAAACWPGGLPARACDTPVYQYALERWLADAYPTLVFYRGKLDEPAAKVVEQLLEAAESEKCNLYVTTVDVDKPMGAALEVWDRHKQASLPYMVVLYPPERSHVKGELWSGPVDAAKFQAVSDSPARRTIAQAIIQRRQVAVWVLLESGNKQADDEAARTLAAALKAAPAELREAGLLEPTTQPATQPATQPDDQIPTPPRRPLPAVLFSTLRVSRADAQEQFFIRLLSSVDLDLTSKEAIAQPMVIPIFARGRALGALVGPTIRQENILHACALLVGPCACEIKNQNPGVDLLFTANWPEAVEPPFVDDLPAGPLAQGWQPGTTRPAGPQGAETGPGAGEGHASLPSPRDGVEAWHPGAASPGAGAADGYGIIWISAAGGLGAVVVVVAVAAVVVRRKGRAA